MPATRPTAARAPRTHVLPPPPPPGSHTARLAVVTWTVVVSAGLAGLGAAPAARPVTPADTAARAASPVFTVTAAAATTTGAPATGAPTTTGAVASMQPAAFTTALPDARARIAIATAMAQIGLPYVWGGNGPAAGDAGFDCSGLTTFSYAAAGVALPRTAQTQYYAGPHVPSGAALQPGDLVFYGTPAVVHHVGMYIGAGRMVNAPTFGKPVQTAYYRWNGDDYLGATRPAATGTPLDGLLITVPRAATQAGPGSTVFAAPSAPLPATPLPDPTMPQPPEADTAAAAVAKTEPPVTAAPAPPTQQTPEQQAPTGTEQTGTQTAAAPPSTSTSPAATTDAAPTTTPSSTTVAATPTTTPTTTPAPPSPTTTAPPPAPKPPATTTTPAPVPVVRPTTVTVAGTTVKVAAVRPAANGLPRANGLWSRAGRPVLRLSAGLVGGAATVTITRTDGSTDTYSVTSTATLSTADAAQAVAGAASGALVMVASAGADSWIVATAT